MQVRPISVDEARGVRHTVLRPGLPANAAVLDHDDDPGTRHLGAFEGARLVGVATFFPERCPLRPDLRAWRLRGMASMPDAQKRGAGRALVEEGLRIAGSAGGTLMWCQARVSALGFYEKMGFTTLGDRFELPASGPHYVMVRDLSDSM